MAAALEYIRDHPGCSQAQAGEHAGAYGRGSLATMTTYGIRAVAILRDRGWVTAQPRPGGGYLLTLTDAGRAVCPAEPA